MCVIVKLLLKIDAQVLDYLLWFYVPPTLRGVSILLLVNLQLKTICSVFCSFILVFHFFKELLNVMNVALKQIVCSLCVVRSSVDSHIVGKELYLGVGKLHDILHICSE